MCYRYPAIRMQRKLMLFVVLATNLLTRYVTLRFSCYQRRGSIFFFQHWTLAGKNSFKTTDKDVRIVYVVFYNRNKFNIFKNNCLLHCSLNNDHREWTRKSRVTWYCHRPARKSPLRVWWRARLVERARSFSQLWDCHRTNIRFEE